MSIVRIKQSNLEQAIEVGNYGNIDDIDIEWTKVVFNASVSKDYSHQYLVEEEITSIRFWGKVRRSRVVGTAGLYTVREDSAAWLGWFSVLPEYRRQGIGQQLLDFTIERAKKGGFSHVKLWTTSEKESADAIRMYERQGFTFEGRHNSGKGYREINYVLPL